MEWLEVTHSPNLLFTTHGDSYSEARCLVWVRGGTEPHKGRCIKRPNRSLKWYADGHSGDFTISHYMPLPTAPESD